MNVNHGPIDPLWWKPGDEIRPLSNYSPRTSLDPEEIKLIRLTDDAIPSEEWIDRAQRRPESPLGLHDLQAMRSASWPVPASWLSAGDELRVQPVFVIFPGELVFRRRLVNVPAKVEKEVFNQKSGKKEKKLVDGVKEVEISVPMVPVFYTIPLRGGTHSIVCSLCDAGNKFGYLGGTTSYLAALAG